MHNLKVSLRLAKLSDLPEMQAMFVDTISAICKTDYSQEQIRAWTSSIENTQQWVDKLTLSYFIVAELDHKIVGYASLDNHQYLDFLYVHKYHQRQGIANRLYHVIENEAIKKNVAVLHVDASKTAIPFFEKKGFETLSQQTISIKGVEMINYKMIKKLRL